MQTLDWMVNVNLFDNETGSFWKGPDKDPTKIKTEVFMLPCAVSFEKEGSLSNSSRWMQWRYKAVNPPGSAKPDLDIMHELYVKVAKLYKEKGGAFPEPILNLSWNVGPKGPDGAIKHPDPHYVAKEINGYTAKDIEVEDPKTKAKTVVAKAGERLATFVNLQDDGSTTCGNWIYCGSYTEKGNMAARRDKTDPTSIGLYPNWAWCWPVNRRILYSRASVNAEGKPWDPKRAVISWDGSKWVGDVPDGPAPPGGTHPFIMLPEGHARIFGLAMADGPFPEHYEPLECPIEKNLLSSQRMSPVVKIFGEMGVGHAADKYTTCDPRFPFVCSTYRVTEHWQTGVMTRWQPWLVELEPQMFVEISRELAEEREITSGEEVIVKSARGRSLGRRHCDQQFEAFQDRRPDGSPGGNSLVLRMGHPARRRRHGESPHTHHRRPQHNDSGVQGLHGKRREERGNVRWQKGCSLMSPSASPAAAARSPASSGGNYRPYLLSTGARMRIRPSSRPTPGTGSRSGSWNPRERGNGCLPENRAITAARPRASGSAHPLREDTPARVP